MAVVVGACSLTFLVVDTVRDDASLSAQVARLPAFLPDTLLHQDFGYDGAFRKPLWDSMLDGLPVDLTLVFGGLVIGNVAGVRAGLRAGARRGSREDRAATIGSAGARAKGVVEERVMRRHALPAALPPVLSLAAVNMALVVTNVTLVETTFQLPGFFRRAEIGQFLGELGHAPGLDVIHLLVFEAAAIIAVAMILCDLAQAWLDPRLRRPG